MTGERLVHHELCFGCGRTNLFGLLMELAPVGEGGEGQAAPGRGRQVRGRGFVKQDHQGARPGSAHEGIVAAALSEAMSFAAGPQCQPAAFELELEAPVPVGTYLEVEARAREEADGELQAEATASAEGKPVASARGTYRRG